MKKRSGFRFGMFLVTIGIVYGDIGTSPLYVMKSILAGNGGISQVNEQFIIGSLSLVIWTVTLLTTIKKLGLPIEYNLNGLLVQKRENEPGYPRREFWEFARDYEIPAIIGVDAHSPKLLADTQLWQESHDLLTGMGYTMLECLPFDDQLKEVSK